MSPNVTHLVPAIILRKRLPLTRGTPYRLCGRKMLQIEWKGKKLKSLVLPEGEKNKHVSE
jgi:hypothetical protein